MKKLFFGGLFLSVVGMSLIGCKKKNISESIKNNTTEQTVLKASVVDEGATILGDQLENPFATENMIQAYGQLGGNPNLIQTNQLYVRFKISEVSQAKLLEERGLILSTIPLDYEVIQYGNYYNDPSLTNQIWMYTTVAPNFNFSGFQYEVLSNLFLPKLIVGTSEYASIFASFDHEDLIDKALLLKGYGDQVPEKAVVKYRPKGYIRVQQVINGTVTSVPVKNLKVRSRWWFDYGIGYTNDNGYFECDELYRKNRNVNIISIFENSSVNIRAIKGVQFWDMFDTERKNIGDYENSALENINYLYVNSTDINSDTKRKWMACHAINSVREYRVYAGLNGVYLPPLALNLWLTNANANGTSLSTYAASPMLKQMSNNSYLINGVQLFLVASGNPWYTVAIQVLEQFPPDITYNYSQNSLYYSNSDQISETFFHELAHGSHYAKVGNSYWSSYISYIIQNNGYGSAASNGSSRIAISEAWAEFCGARFAHLKYGNNTSIGNTWHQEIENFKPYPNPNNWAYWAWIPEGVMHDLTDVGEPVSSTIPNVTDNVSGFTITQCFGSMDVDITSVASYKNRFISEYGNSQQLGINTLFETYGY